MDQTYLLELINQSESQILEFKCYFKVLNSDIFETVCSFANRDGGIIIIGIEDKTKNIVGVQEEYVEKMKAEFTNGCCNDQIITPKLTYQLEEIQIDNKIILYCTIYQSSQVHKFKNKIMDRQNDADIDITNSSELVSTMYLRKKDGYSEDKIYPFCSLEHLNLKLIDKARKLATLNHSNHPWKEMDDLTLLQSAGLYVKNYLNGEEGVTLAGILLFGKDETIKSVCPNHRTDCIKRVSNIDRYDDRNDIRTNLIDTYYFMIEFISKHLDQGFEINENGVRYSPRDYLFREAITNIIIHREYRDRTVATMVINKTEVVFENGCIPYRSGPITVLNFRPKSKNPRIAEVFKNMGLADELGSGIRNMYKYNKIYSKASPIIVEGDIFTTTIPLVSKEEKGKMLANQKELILKFLNDNDYITNQLVQTLFNVQKTRATELLSSMTKDNLLRREGNGKSTKYYII